MNEPMKLRILVADYTRDTTSGEEGPTVLEQFSRMGVA